MLSDYFEFNGTEKVNFRFRLYRNGMLLVV